MEERNSSSIRTRFIWFLIVIGIILLSLAAGVITLKAYEYTARTQEAKAIQMEAAAEIESYKPDVIVARSQANINNSVAMGNLKDSALIILLVILVFKDKIKKNEELRRDTSGDGFTQCATITRR